MTIAEWQETTVLDRRAGLSASLLALPSQAMAAEQGIGSAPEVASDLGLANLQSVPSAALPMLLAGCLLFKERESCLVWLRQIRTEHGWVIPNELLNMDEFRFAEQLALRPTLALTKAPAAFESMAAFVSGAPAGEALAYLGFAERSATPLVLLRGPRGVVLCGATAGLGRAMDEGLRDRVLHLVKGHSGPGPESYAESLPEPSAPSPAPLERQAHQQAGGEPDVQGSRMEDGVPLPEMVIIPAGAFDMGSSAQEDEGPVHQVTIPKPFAMGKYPVTFSEYDPFARATGRPLPADNGWGRRSQPVVNVSWSDAVTYAVWLSERTGERYRLPTEAEWEYAARAGTQSAYWWGDEVGHNHANCDGCGSHWDDLQPAPVGSFPPNAHGLHEMLGNVWEWVEDCWHDDYTGAPTDGSAWLSEDCGPRMVRGGSWAVGPEHLRCALRYGAAPDELLDSLGFRLVQEL